MDDSNRPGSEADATTGPGEDVVSLYRRFRPGRFGEVRGQPHVVMALRNAVREGRVSHAYLFSGPRGTGKTSTARILARALNCVDPSDGEPCGRCVSCVEIARGSSLDVHELDAASNNGVDAMRDLVSHAALGTPGRSKVYIVDEVHMLSTAAANALLKTLEEPPPHVVFVLATTDPQKVPATIRSRTQHFDFRLLATGVLTELLHDVRDRAGLPLDDDALSVAVRRGRGSARDALSALDQVVAAGAPDDARPEVREILDALGDEDASRSLVLLASLHEAGWGPQQLATELVDELREAFLAALAPQLAASSGAELDRVVQRAADLGLARLVRAVETLGRAQVDMRDAPDPRVVLEVALARLAKPELDDSPAAVLDRLARLERASAAGGTGRTPRPPEASPPDTAASRPTIGAYRRRPAPPAGPGTGPDTPGSDGPSPPAGAPSPRAARAEGPDVPLPRASVADATLPGSEGAQGTPAHVDRDTVVEAWGDHVLRSLTPKAKALFGTGRFLSVEDRVAVYALPTDQFLDRCAPLRGTVEEALAAHLGTPLRLDLVVEPVPAGGAGGDGAPPRRDTTARGAAGGAPEGHVEPDPDEVDFDPADPGEPVEIESVAQARLLEAFPGAEEVTDHDGGR